MDLDEIKQRFASLTAKGGTIGGEIHSILARAAADIAGLFGNDRNAAGNSVIQRLEQAAHLAVTHPQLDRAPQAAADPTPAGQQEPAADQQQPTTDTNTAQTAPSGQSEPSEGNSTP